MASSDSQIDRSQRGHPKRAELLDVNINTGVQSIKYTERFFKLIDEHMFWKEKFTTNHWDHSAIKAECNHNHKVWELYILYYMKPQEGICTMGDTESLTILLTSCWKSLKTLVWTAKQMMLFW